MKYSKKQIIEKTLADHNVAKLVEGIIRTERDSDMRNLMVETFEAFFTAVSTDLMIENIGYKFDEDIIIKSRLSFSAWFKLMHTTGLNNKILTILCYEDMFKICIDIEGDTHIIMREFSIEDDEVELLMRVFYSKDERINKKIDEVLSVLRNPNI